MADLKELGRTGLNRWGGHVSEEFLPELSGNTLHTSSDLDQGILYALETANYTSFAIEVFSSAE